MVVNKRFKQNKNEIIYTVEYVTIEKCKETIRKTVIRPTTQFTY